MEELPIPIIGIIMSYMNGRELLETIKINKFYKDIYEKYKKIIPLDFSYSLVHDEDLEYAKDVYSINLRFCKYITDRGLKYLSKVHTICLAWCRISNDGIKHLTNVHTLDIE
jgi:hypothetical protein